MAIINFYHLTVLPVGKALPKLLEKVINIGNILVNTSDEESVKELDLQMWTYTTKFFLPHGVEGDGFESKQPVFITAKNNNANNSKILAITKNALVDNIDDFDKSIYMFDGNNEKQTKIARKHWAKLSDENHTLTYWQQDPKGGWQQNG